MITLNCNLSHMARINGTLCRSLNCDKCVEFRFNHECRFKINSTCNTDIIKLCNMYDICIYSKYLGEGMYEITTDEKNLSKLMYFNPNRFLQAFLQDVGNRYYKW